MCTTSPSDSEVVQNINMLFINVRLSLTKHNNHGLYPPNQQENAARGQDSLTTAEDTREYKVDASLTFLTDKGMYKSRLLSSLLKA